MPHGNQHTNTLPLPLVRPFLLLATRAEDAAADNEYAAMLQYSGLPPEQLIRHRLEAVPLPEDLQLDDYSGVILGGSPFNNSDPAESKSPTQLRVEADMRRLLDEVVPRDFPLLGACYGIGSVGTHQGAVLDRRYAEPVSRVTITLTEDGVTDPLFAGSPTSFEAFVGHKEAISELPPQAKHLASSPTCPVQAFKIGENVYATQFHPELDADGIATRVDVYAGYGYFDPSQADTIKAHARERNVPHAATILRNFVQRYAQPSDAQPAFVAASAEVAPSASVGEGSKVWDGSVLRPHARVGRNCVIGRNAFVDSGVIVGDNCKIQNNTLLYSPAQLGNGVFIGPAVVLTNDPYPRAVNVDGSPKSAEDWEPAGVELGDGAAVGANSVVLGGVRVGAWALIGAGSTVVRDVPAHALVAGNPARQLGWVDREGRRLQALPAERWTDGVRTYEVGPEGLVQV